MFKLLSITNGSYASRMLQNNIKKYFFLNSNKFLYKRDIVLKSKGEKHISKINNNNNNNIYDHNDDNNNNNLPAMYYIVY